MEEQRAIPESKEYDGELKTIVSRVKLKPSIYNLQSFYRDRGGNSRSNYVYNKQRVMRMANKPHPEHNELIKKIDMISKLRFGQQQQWLLFQAPSAVALMMKYGLNPKEPQNKELLDGVKKLYLGMQYAGATPKLMNSYFSGHQEQYWRLMRDDPSKILEPVEEEKESKPKIKRSVVGTLVSTAFTSNK